MSKSKLLSLCEIAAGRLAVGGTDNQVHLFDVPTKSAINVLKQHTGSVSALASRDDYLVTGSFDTSIRWFLASEVAKNKRKKANATSVATPVAAPRDSGFRVTPKASPNNDEFRIGQ